MSTNFSPRNFRWRLKIDSFWKGMENKDLEQSFRLKQFLIKNSSLPKISQLYFHCRSLSGSHHWNEDVDGMWCPPTSKTISDNLTNTWEEAVLSKCRCSKVVKFLSIRLFLPYWIIATKAISLSPSFKYYRPGLKVCKYLKWCLSIKSVFYLLYLSRYL